MVASTATGWAQAGRLTWDMAGRGAYWQHIIISRVALTRTELVRGDQDETLPEPVLQRVEELLVAAEDAALRPGPRMRLWLGGGPVNRAFVSLHAAQILLARYEPAGRLDARLRFAMTRVRATLPETAERRIELEERYIEVTEQPAGAPEKRAVLEKAVEWSYNSTDAQYARLRSFRNILTGVSFAVLVLLAVLAGMVQLWPQALRLCFAGEGGQACPTGTVATAQDALIIMVLGAAGGALAAVLTVSRLQGTSTPYSVPLALAMLKLPVGALTAVLGLILIHGRFVPGLDNLDTPGQILAYAIVFGVAQHAVTTLVDRRGQELLADIPGKRAPKADGKASR
ncbi:MAG: hypothetical protein ABW022_19135 [Actinoplanes sp.]